MKQNYEFMNEEENRERRSTRLLTQEGVEMPRAKFSLSTSDNTTILILTIRQTHILLMLNEKNMTRAHSCCIALTSL